MSGRTSFQPLGEEPRWQIVHRVLSASDVGEVVSYEALADALDLDPKRDRSAIQQAVRRAIVHLQESHRRTAVALPNEGYQIADPRKQLAVARGRQKRSNNQLESGHREATSVDLNQIDDPTIARALQAVGQAFALQIDFNRRFDARQKRLEKTLSLVVERAERTEDEISELKSRLASLEKPTDDEGAGLP